MVNRIERSFWVLSATLCCVFLLFVWGPIFAEYFGVQRARQEFYFVVYLKNLFPVFVLILSFFINVKLSFVLRGVVGLLLFVILFLWEYFVMFFGIFIATWLGLSL